MRVGVVVGEGTGVVSIEGGLRFGLGCGGGGAIRGGRVDALGWGCDRRVGGLVDDYGGRGDCCHRAEGGGVVSVRGEENAEYSYLVVQYQ